MGNRLAMNEKEESGQPARQSGELLYLDDLHVGQRFTSETYLMEEARIKEFAADLDPRPFHLDETAGKTSVLGNRRVGLRDCDCMRPAL